MFPGLSMDWSTITPTKRAYNDAFMHACHAEGWSEPEKRRVLSVLDGAYELGPISLVDDEGMETNALVQRESLPKTERQYSASSVAQAHQDARLARERGDARCVLLRDHCKRPVQAGAPWTRVHGAERRARGGAQPRLVGDAGLALRVQLLLAGMMLLNGVKGTAVVANTIEVYGRERNVDSHHESYKSTRTTRSSLPPATTRYPNAWPLTIADGDDKKLINGI